MHLFTMNFIIIPQLFVKQSISTEKNAINQPDQPKLLQPLQKKFASIVKIIYKNISKISDGSSINPEKKMGGLLCIWISSNGITRYHKTELPQDLAVFTVN